MVEEKNPNPNIFLFGFISELDPYLRYLKVEGAQNKYSVKSELQLMDFQSTLAFDWLTNKSSSK